jgi:hypothetical protein
VRKGLCDKFNHSDYCLQIDDNGQVVTNIATSIRKITHVPVQTWDGWKPYNWLASWFSWLFPLLGPIAVIGAVLCFGPFLLNLLIHFFSPRLHQTPNVTLHTLLLPWTIGHPLGFGPLTPTGALLCLLSAGSS